MQIVIFSPLHSPRMAYVFKVLFEEVCPQSYEWTSDQGTYLRSSGAKINYSDAPLDPAELWITPETLLFDLELLSYPIQTKWVEGCPWLHFGAKKTGHLPGEVFAGSFYLLSRYEEYLPFVPDRYGRFTAAASLAQREGFLQMAVIQRWVKVLFQELQVRYPEFSSAPLPYQFVPTYDVDMPWVFCFRPWWKQFGGALKDLFLGKISRLSDRFQAWRNPDNDPFFRFVQLKSWHERFSLKPRFFFLMADAAKYDTNPSPQLPAQQALIRSLAAQYPLGIHPSYASNENPTRIHLEKERLEQITGQTISHSRQHFLKLRFAS